MRTLIQTKFNFWLFLFLSIHCLAQESEPAMTAEEIASAVEEVNNSMKYEYGTVDLLGGIAKIQVPEGYKFLNKEQSEYVLTELWGNPPSEVQGLLFPADMGPVSDDFTYAVEISYSEEGYIKDDDAKGLDYNELLKEMKSDAKEGNVYRAEQGYATVDLIGWASAPFYDDVNKKLHWAKELKFEGSDENTLNYNIRILGRKGYLNLNAIGDIDVLPVFQNNVDEILASVDFSEGNQYADFNPDIDKMAAYGIGGLIAGKVLLKAGLLAKFGLILVKFWKVIALALVAIGAGVKNYFGGKTEEKKGSINS